MEAFQCHGSNVGPMGTMRKGSGSVTGGVPFLACGLDGDVARSLNAHPSRSDLDTETFVAHTLRAEGHDASEESGGDGRGLDPKPVTSALTKEQTPATFSGQGVRRLMPHELERLQGFPDDYTRIPYRGKSAEDCPDGPRAKTLGNSMAVPVMRWIGERIALVEATSSPTKP